MQKKRDRGTRSSSAGAPKPCEEVGPARRGDPSKGKGKTTELDTHVRAESDMSRNWNKLTNENEDELALPWSSNIVQATTIGGIEEGIFKAIATQLGRIVAENQGDTLQLPEAAHLGTLLQGIGGLKSEYKKCSQTHACSSTRGTTKH